MLTLAFAVMMAGISGTGMMAASGNQLSPRPVFAPIVIVLVAKVIDIEIIIITPHFIGVSVMICGTVH